MIRNYFRISLRYMGRRKEYTVINILGLAVSIACCILIMLFVRSELSYDALYRAEQRTAGVFTTFSVLAISLACMGLFAIAAYTLVQRTKEIGIRKVLRANVSSIIIMVSTDFLWPVIIATAIASPIAWYLSNKWLQDFAYRVAIHSYIFFAAGIGCLIIAAAMVSIQALKAASVNPVQSLRSD